MENVLAIIGIILGVVNLIVLILYIDKVSKYKKMYDNSLAKFNNTANVKDKFVELFDRLETVEKKCVDTKEYCDTLESNMSSTIRKVGLVKYNAYEDSNNKLSFSLALLDKEDNGIILNSVHSIHGSNMYVKKVIKGKVNERISEEESMSLKYAIQGSDYEEDNEPAEVKKVDTRKINRVRR